MNSGAHPFRRSLAAALLSLALGPAHALTLGPIRVISHLGQPLSARIPLLALSSAEGQTLLAQMASPYAYHQAGLHVDPVLPFIRVTLASDRQGDPYIHLATDRPVWSPYLDLMITLAWQDTLPQGATLHSSHDYTILLDPPAEGAAPLLQPMAATQQAPAPAANTARQAGAASSAMVLPVHSMPAGPAKTGSGSTHLRTVRRGDTLWGIAHSVTRSGESMPKMADAIWRSNPHAFVAHNPNLLRVGSRLRIPGAARVLAATPLPDRPVKPTAPNPVVDVQVGSDAPVLRMGDAILGAHASAPSPALTATTASASDLARRLALAKAQLQQAQIAYDQAQARLRSLRAQRHESRPVAATAMTVSGATATLAQDGAREQRSIDVPRPQPRTPRQPRSSLWTWSVGAALVAAAIVALWLYRRRRARNQPPPWALTQQVARTFNANPRKPFSSPISPTRMLETERSLAQLQTSSGLQGPHPSDVWQPQASSIVPIDDEPDPLTEADFYVLHDRPHQALELLRDAAARHPDHVPVHLKILEILAGIHDRIGFEDYARNVGDRFGPGIASKIQMLQARLAGPTAARGIPPDSAKGAESIAHQGSGSDRGTSSLPALDLDLSSDFLVSALRPDRH